MGLLPPSTRQAKADPVLLLPFLGQNAGIQQPMPLRKRRKPRKRASVAPFIVAAALLWMSAAPHASATEIPFSTPTIVDAEFNGVQSVRAVDLDGDGDLDILGASDYAGDIAWWENANGDGSAWAKHTVDADFTNAHSVRAADMDCDGDLDVLGAASGADDIVWWENISGDGSAWAEHVVDAEYDEAFSAEAVDLDDDGDLDVAGIAGQLQSVTWWENLDGTATNWSEHTIDTEYGNPHSLSVADIDRDGDPDLVVTWHNPGCVTWWENDGTPQDDVGGDGNSWTERYVAAYDGAYGSCTADVDGDGDLDLLCAATDATGSVKWWKNADGAGTEWTESLVDGAFDGAIDVKAVDLDGDGDLDVLGAARLDDDIAWWENTSGEGNSWTKRTVDGAFDGARSVCAADIDGDGDLDTVGAGYDANTIAYWENTTVHRNARFEIASMPLGGRNIIGSNFDYAASARAADVDG